MNKFSRTHLFHIEAYRKDNIDNFVNWSPVQYNLLIVQCISKKTKLFFFVKLFKHQNLYTYIDKHNCLLLKCISKNILPNIFIIIVTLKNKLAYSKLKIATRRNIYSASMAYNLINVIQVFMQTAIFLSIYPSYRHDTIEV